MPKTAISLTESFNLLDAESVAGAVGDLGGVHAGLGVGVVHIESPVLAVGVVVHGDAIDGLDVQAVLAVLALDQAQFGQASPTVAASVWISKSVWLPSASTTAKEKTVAPSPST